VVNVPFAVIMSKGGIKFISERHPRSIKLFLFEATDDLYNPVHLDNRCHIGEAGTITIMLKNA
jgi:hypothetical protein